MQPLTDFPDRFERDSVLWVGGEPRRVEASHWQRGLVIVKLRGIDDPEMVTELRGTLLAVPEEDLRPLDEDQYYIHDLIGLAALTPAGVALGTIVDVINTGANHVLVVHGEQGELLLPFIADVVQAVDLGACHITVELLEGLQPSPPPGSGRPRRLAARGRRKPHASAGSDLSRENG